MSVRVRIAPAPSGSLHVGNVRTALFNWLFARHNDGVFILRVEDTDRSRVAEEHVHAIQFDLKWIGLDWDEGPGVGGPHAPYRQSERLEIYADAVKRMQASGAVYRCYCTKEELDARRKLAMAEGRRPGYDGRCYRLADQERAVYETEGRPFTIRFHVPDEGSTSFVDIVTGEVRWEHSQMDDFVIVRSDGLPLYDLAATVDDGIMEISHVIRGLDLQSSTPRQILMHEVLGYSVPRYAHLPLINGPDGRPLSKRHGPDSIGWYRENGFLPQTLMNYLAYMGWGTADQALLSSDELVEKFDLDHVHPSPATFDMARLEWMNGEYIRMLDDPRLSELMVPWLAGEGLVDDPPNEEQMAKVATAAPVVKTRMKRLDEGPSLVRSWFVDVEPNPEDFERVMREEWVPALLEHAVDALSALDEWSVESIEAALRGAVEATGLKPRVAFRPLYVAISGAAASAPLFDTVAVVGRDKTLERLKKARAAL